MLRPAHPSFIVVFIALAMVATVAGCGDGAEVADTTTTTEFASVGEAAATTTSAPSTTTTAPAIETTTTTTTTTTTAVAVTTTDAPPSDGPTDVVPDANCLVGDWVVSEAQMNRFYDALEAEAPGIEFTVTGQTYLSFDVDTYEYRPDFVLALSLSGLSGTGDTAGTITGTYEVIEGVVVTTSEVNAITIDVEVGGQRIDGSALGNDLLNSSPINDAPLDCLGSSPVLGFRTAADRVAITLDPA